jgi:hypothetical protein
VSPPGSEPVLITRGVAEAVIEIESVCVADFCGELESVTLTVKLDWPAAVGVPEIIPPLALRVRPVGSAPEMIDQL